MILRFEIDGIEFFVNEKTNEVGLSISGLARLCGVDHSSIIRLLDKLKSVVHKTTPQEGQSQAGYAIPVVHKNTSPVVHKTTPKTTQSQAGYSIPVVHKTSSTKSKGGRPKKSKDDLPECLKCLLEEDIYLDIGNQYKNATVIHEYACSAILFYYALEAEETTEEAKQALWQFQKIGFRTWVHKITGFQPKQEPIAQKPQTRAEELDIKPRYIQTIFDRHIFYNDLFNKELTAPMYRVYLYFLDCQITGHEASVDEVCQYALVVKHHLYDLIQKMQPYGLVPEYFDIDDSTRSTEAQILAKMHEKLGGNVEVQTIHGPIDLLTPTELIEIKRIEDWKEGLGQIMVKSHTFPEHAKRLHLFGQSDRTLRNIKATCKQLEITVSYETAGAITR